LGLPGILAPGIFEAGFYGFMAYLPSLHQRYPLSYSWNFFTLPWNYALSNGQTDFGEKENLSQNRKLSPKNWFIQLLEGFCSRD
jgi:hypothetical protein